MTKDRSTDNLLRYPEVKARTSLGRTTITKRVKEGTFPAPVQISAGLVAFYESDINEWLADPMGWRAAA